MDKDLDDDVPLPRPPFLIELFPTGVPHMRYQRIVTLPNENQVLEVARGLWQNSRLVLKKLTTDRRVRFGVRGAGTEEEHKQASRAPVPAGQALITAPCGLSEATVRKYAALFGLFTRVSTRGASHTLGRTEYVVAYGRKESVLISHDVTPDSTMVTFEANCAEDDLLEAKRAFQDRQGQMLENQDDMGDWWRMVMGREKGAETAVAEEAQRLTADNLAALLG